MLHRLLAAVPCVLLGSAPAFAATLTVPGDHPTIQAAVDAAVPGDVIEIKGTFTEEVVVQNRNDLHLKGKGKAILDGQGARTPLTISDSSGIMVEKLRFVNAAPSGLLIEGGQDVTVVKCRFEDMPPFADPADPNNLLGAIGLDAQGTLNAVFERNKFTDVSGDALILNDVNDAPPSTDDSAALKNKFLRIGQDGIEVDGDRNRLELNKIVEALADGMDVDGDDNVALKNKITKVGDEGIEVDGRGNTFESNKLSKVGADGFDVRGSDNVVRGNSITLVLLDGIEVGPGAFDPNDPAAGILIEGNKVVRAAENGVRMDSGGNTVRGNTTKKSAFFGLRDTSQTGANVYQDNKFDSEQID